MNNKRSAGRPVPGYSLVELMVVVAVAGALAALAMPAFDQLVRDSRRTTVVNELLATVLLARSQAARGQVVVVCGFDDANGNGQLDPAERACSGRDWDDGWLAAPWTDADSDGRVDGEELPPMLLRQFVMDTAGVRVAANGITAGAAPSGTLVLRPFSANSSNGTLTVCDARGAAAARAVVIAPTGRARVARTRADGQPLVCP